ncbi:transposase [Elysia marginata]|uniref:Transposase n=1 Tax=Elysia marginata TaxID=1093978 RepID=A0AAV4EYA5_9GAST|nr:transposase [Elysia marginata]
MSEEMLETVFAILSDHPDYTLIMMNQELRVRLPDAPHVTSSTISNILKGQLIIMKKLEDAPVERNAVRTTTQRRDFATWVGADGTSFWPMRAGVAKQKGRTSLDDEPKSGHPKTSINEENTTRVRYARLLLNSKFQRVRFMKKSMTLWDIGRCLQDGFQKCLTEDHKLQTQRVEISQGLLLRCQQDNGDESAMHIGVRPFGCFRAKINLFDNLITGDETWVHVNTPETLKHPSSPVTKKFKVQKSAGKVIATVFWDEKSVILLDIS